MRTCELAGRLTWWMHNAADHEPRCSTASKMQSRALFHSQVLFQPPFRKEIRGKLYGAAETSSDHSGANTAIKTLDTLVAIYLSHSIVCILIFVLCADR